MLIYALNHYALFLLVLLRLVAFIATCPLMSMKAIPTWAKLGLGATTAILMTPSVTGQVPDPFSNAGEYIIAALQETATGMLLGFGASMVFSAFTIAGQLIDIQIGFSTATEFDPQTGQQTSLTSSFVSMLFSLYFLGVNGLDGLMLAILNSYRFIPLASFHLPSDTWGFLTHMLGVVMTLAVEFAAPLSVALLLCDITFALLSRAVPQMNVFVVGLPAKLLVGLTLFATIMPAVVYLFGILFSQLFTSLNTLLTWLGG